MANCGPGPLSRRRFLCGVGAAVGGAVAIGATAGCGSVAQVGPSLRIANWPDYIDGGDEGTVKRFQRRTGIVTSYSEEISDNERYFSEMAPQLSAGQRIGPDLVVLTGWMAGRMIGLGWAEPLPLASIPNAVNLSPELESPPWDPLGRFTLPWQSGMVVIAYNAEATGFELAGVDDLFDERLAGRVGMLKDYRDTLGILGISAGIDLSNPRVSAFDSVLARLEDATRSGHIRTYTGNKNVERLAFGELDACLARSGDVAQLAADRPELKVAMPDAGTAAISDVMVVPKGSPNIDSAAQWMDFVYNPSNAARVTESVRCISPVSGVADRLRAMGPDAAKVADNPMVVPQVGSRSGLQTFGAMPNAEEVRFEERFAAVVALAEGSSRAGG
ncbi:MAG: spermidine/putrescine ABC transporter substrate-binding protein [Microthrixaceae bacterium]